MAGKYSMLAKVGADTTQFTRAMSRTQKQTKTFGSQMMKLGGLMAGAFSAQQLVSFGKKAVELYNVQAKAEAKLQTSLGDNIKGFERLKKVASDLQGVTLFGDEATIEAMSFLAQMKMSEAEIKKLMPLIQDFATAQNMDLAGAAKLVSKSFGSSTNALSRYGIEISGAAGSSQRFSELQQALNDQVGGQAKAAAETGTGAMVQLTNAWGDFAEVIGSKLVPAMNAAATSSTSLLQDLTKVVSSDNLKWWEKLAGFYGSIGFGNAYGGRMGFGSMAKESDRRDVEEQNSPANYPNIPEWYTSMMDEMARDAEARAAEMARRAAQAFSGNFAISINTPNQINGGDGIAAPKKRSTFTDLTGIDLAGYDAEIEKFNQLNEQIRSSMEGLMEDLVSTMAENLGSALVTGQWSNFFGSILTMFGDFVTQMGKMFIAYGIATEAFKNAIKSLNGVVLVAAGIALTAIGGAIRSYAASGMNPPALAEGGLAYGPTAAIVGDNPNARIDPEVIAPLSKLKGLTSNSVEVTGQFKLKGDDMVVLLQRANRRRELTL